MPSLGKCVLDKVGVLQASVLEYGGDQTTAGHDISFAQALLPLNCLQFYFTVKVLDTGKKGYLAVGIADRVRKLLKSKKIIVKAMFS